jgi:hypothetical protein
MSTRRLAVVLLMLLACAFAFDVAAQPKEVPATLETVVAKLDTIIDRIDTLERRVARLESSFADRARPDVMGTVGPYRIDRCGFLYDGIGRQIGIWGVNGENARIEIDYNNLRPSPRR